MELEVDRTDLHRVRVVPDDDTPLDEGQARLRIDRFAFTTNNITYAVFGDALRYWDFFPPAPVGDDAPAHWGRIPVWGFADVIECRAEGVAAGERFFGYFPMGSSLTVQVGKVDQRGFADTAEHRTAMAGAYNRYQRSAADPLHRAEREDHQSLLYPLFFTSFLIDDAIADHDEFGATQIVVSSASAKTAIGVAQLTRARGGPRVVGLTSPGNVAFVEELGVYDTVLPYDEVASMAAASTVYVDIAGDRDVLHAVHTLLDGVLRHSMTVGGTHWDHLPQVDAELPGPTPAFFFAPGQIAKRTKDWGRAALDARIATAWSSYVEWCDGWLELRHATGAAEVEAVYRELLEGRTDPRVGHICHLPADRP